MRRFTKKQFFFILVFVVVTRIIDFFQAMTLPPEARFVSVIRSVVITISIAYATIALWKNTKRDDGDAEGGISNEDRDNVCDKTKKGVAFFMRKDKILKKSDKDASAQVFPNSNSWHT